MKHIYFLKKAIVVLLAFAFIFALCSCGGNVGAPLSTGDNTTANTSADNTPSGTGTNTTAPSAGESDTSPSSGIADNTSGAAGNDSNQFILYQNDRLGFSIEIPSSWAGLYGIDDRGESDSDSNIAIYDIANYNALNPTHDPIMTGGYLVTFGRSQGKFTSDNPPVAAGCFILGEKDGYTYWASYPKDVQYVESNSELTQEYIQMSNDLDGILASFKFDA